MKEQGFTLIELLAVIVILAIIALIAIPMISKIIDKTEDSAVLRSAELYIDGVNQSIMRANLNNKFRPKECIIQEDGNLICDGNRELKVETIGTRPSDGILIIEDRRVKSFTGMILDIYELETDENLKVFVKNVLEEQICKVDEQITPELYSSLTPVVYKRKSWIVANPSEGWYNYCTQKWANAVILKNGVVKNEGDTIDISKEIQGMFVWIPRYEYKIEGQYGSHLDGTTGSRSLPGEISVNFINASKTVASEGYRIHSAFNFGGRELNGIWVGKFETTGTSTEPTIIPTQKSLIDQSINDQFNTARIFNTYLSNSNIDAHMAKNSEWGAVAYLSQSKYGKYGNANYVGEEKQVMINNCAVDGYYQTLTGIGANLQNEGKSTTTCATNTYETLKGQAASTTGNIYGVYDMSGGSLEYVMGVLNKTVSESEISTWPMEKYYDNYTSTDPSSTSISLSETACDGGICYGHALSETARWYGDSAAFVRTSVPWFIRGGRCDGGSGAGVFNSFSYTGHSSSDLSFRVVITNS